MNLPASPFVEQLEARVTGRWKPEQDFAQAQRTIYEEVLFVSDTIRSSNFQNISTEDLQLLFELYDNVFFDGLIRQSLIDQKLPLQMRLSKRMTNAGGKTTMLHPYGIHSNRGKSFEIAISSTLLFESFNRGQPASVVGVDCQDRLSGLQRIFEHELIHLIEMLVWLHSSCSARRFKLIAKNFFGHRQSSHQLTSPKDSAAKQFGITTGDYVEFDLNGSRLRGFINRITRRATVLVKNKRGHLYDDGFRYIKYYVPIERLSKV